MAEYAIDWLSYTAKLDYATRGAAAAFLDMVALGDNWIETQARYGYAWAAKTASGIIVMGGGKEGMGTHVILPGQACQDGKGLAQARNAVRRGYRVTRIDLTIDTHNGLAPRALYEAAQRKEHKCTAKRSLLLEGDGSTLYLGSRSSERYMRVYDKAAQMKDTSGRAWTRIELELKGDSAQNAANALLHNKAIDVIYTAINDYVQFPTVSKWNDALSERGEEVSIEPTRRKLTDTRRWLLDTVAGALAKEIQDDNAFMTAFLEAVNAKLKM